MPPRTLALAAATLLALAATASAQPTDWSKPRLAADVTPAAEPPCPAWPSRGQCDLLVGLPTGLRAQFRLNNDPAAAWLMEGFAGAEYVFPTVGVGLRRRVVCWDGAYGTFAVNPGVDLYGSFLWFGAGGAVVGDVDFIWNRRFADGGSFDLGLKLGAGPATGGVSLGDLGGGSRSGVIPVASLIFGLHF